MVRVVREMEEEEESLFASASVSLSSSFETCGKETVLMSGNISILR